MKAIIEVPYVEYKTSIYEIEVEDNINKQDLKEALLQNVYCNFVNNNVAGLKNYKIKKISEKIRDIENSELYESDIEIIKGE